MRLLDMKKTMEMYRVDDYAVYAGYTLRTASNMQFVLEQIKLKTKLPVISLSNSEHRFFGYQAVASLPSFSKMVEDSAVIVDVGGASLQITLFRHSKVITTQHLHLGTYSTMESLRKLDKAKDYREQISSLIDKELDTFAKVYMKDIEPTYLIILGDRVSKKLTELGESSDGILTETEKFKKFIKNMMKEHRNSVASDWELYDEAQVFLEPLMLLHFEIAKMLPTKYTLLPGVSVNEGIAYRYAYQHKLLKSEHNFEEDILSASWSIARRYGSYEPHLKALQKISVQIFDSMKKYHSMTKRERLLMQVVCILHDCGKYISLSEAADCTYTIIKSSEILGLTHKEREMVALIASYNRRDLPPYRNLADRISKEDYWVMVELLAILKVANAMDRSHKQKFKNISMSVRNKELVITIEASDSISLEKGMFNNKADFFEEVFAIRPVIKEKRLLLQ